MHTHDDRRIERIGMPEAVLCEPKTDAQLELILRDLQSGSDPVMLTRLAPERFEDLPAELTDGLDYDAESRTAVLRGALPDRAGKVVVVAAGTSDHPAAAEAIRTLTFSGVETELVIDVGVAGIWRLQERLDDIATADIIIAVAGMDAALVSVLGGLMPQPIIAVPTSVGYGVAEGGTTALHSALASCAQGVAVMNIDNGFGAACAALRILRLLDSA
jgi:NCAIR mutase (PurE)-related protein